MYSNNMCSVNNEECQISNAVSYFSYMQKEISITDELKQNYYFTVYIITYHPYFEENNHLGLNIASYDFPIYPSS